MSEYITTDIILASTLKVYGHRLTSITLNGNKGSFHFADVPDDLLMNFDLGKCLVEPLMFNNALKALTTSVKRLVKV